MPLMEAMQKKDICSTREAAAMLGVSLRTVQLWVEAGRLQATKTVGGHRRIQVGSVQALKSSLSRNVAEPAPRAPALLRILLVEDNPVLRRLYEVTVKSWGIPVATETADNGFDALLRMGENPPDILITDIDMPGLDGIAMINMLRSKPEFRHVEIIVVTGLDSQSIQDRGGLPKDVTVYLKPAPFSLIQARLQEVANSRLSRSVAHA